MPLVPALAVSIFKVTRMGSVIPKEIKYNLLCDDVRRDFLRLIYLILSLYYLEIAY